MIEDNLVSESLSTNHGGAVAKAAQDIRTLILQRDLMPGEQVRQEDLARQIGTSRGPIREALQVLTVEGVLRYERNRGYFVTHFTRDEMRQIYVIRDLLESEILGSLPAPSQDHIAELRTVNSQIQADLQDPDAIIGLNKKFHDLIFANSPLNVLNAELENIGRMTIAYQALSVHTLTELHLITEDHDKMINALEMHDLDELVDLSRVHRNRTLDRLAPLLK